MQRLLSAIVRILFQALAFLALFIKANKYQLLDIQYECSKESGAAPAEREIFEYSGEEARRMQVVVNGVLCKSGRSLEKRDQHYHKKT